MAKLEIAQIEERTERLPRGPAAMALFGLLGIILATVGDDSAIRLAAWGTIWIGWNVLALMALIVSLRKTYVVTREIPDDPQA